VAAAAGSRFAAELLINHVAKGLGLRFPRFLRLRPDHKPEEASGPDTIAELYNKQARRVR
jgi:DNA ligase-1